MEVPQASYAGRRTVVALASIPLAFGIAWGVHHMMGVIAAANGRGNPLALTWLVTFLMLWWVPLSWLERPRTVRRRQQRMLEKLTVTAVVPVYNEPPERLRDCLQSMLSQTRRPTTIHVVDDGTVKHDHTDVRAWFEVATVAVGVIGLWSWQPNAGKRHAQMRAIANDTADIVLTVDSDTILDAKANEEGIKAFGQSDVHSVAGMVAVWNSRGNWLARLTCMLYTPFTRGFRSAQSVLGQVMVNSGTLAWYRGPTLRRYAGVYENEMSAAARCR